jgi:tRNA 2-thiouridine synthesizing protein D
MSRFCLIIQGSPATAASHSALKFARAVLASGHDICRLFFFQDGVLNAASAVSVPQDEPNLPQQWQQLIRSHNLDAVVCVSSALKRGIVDAAEAARLELPAPTMLDGFTLSGLGQLVDAGLAADRVLNFAP